MGLVPVYVVELFILNFFFSEDFLKMYKYYWFSNILKIICMTSFMFLTVSSLPSYKWSDEKDSNI